MKSTRDSRSPLSLSRLTNSLPTYPVLPQRTAYHYQPGTCKDNYKLGKKLGSGAFSDVLQATLKKGDKIVMAAKRIKKSMVTKPADIAALKREVR